VALDQIVLVLVEATPPRDHGFSGVVVPVEVGPVLLTNKDHRSDQEVLREVRRLSLHERFSVLVRQNSLLGLQDDLS
jgi:hypothetical protein